MAKALVVAGLVAGATVACGPSVAFATSGGRAGASWQAQASVVDLRPRFEKGQEVRYVFEMDSESRIDFEQAAEEDTSQSVAQEFGLLMRVVEARPEEGATVELVIESVKVAIRTPLGEETFDSTRPAGPDDAGVLAGADGPVVGTKLTLAFDADGRIVRVTGGEGLALAASPGGAGGVGPRDLLGEIFSARKGDGTARVGETWTNEVTIGDSPMGGLRLVTEHTLKSAARGEAKVAFRGRVDPKSLESPGPATITEATHEGMYIWDTRAGMLKSLEMEQAVGMDLGAAGMEARTTSRMKTRVRRVD